MSLITRRPRRLAAAVSLACAAALAPALPASAASVPSCISASVSDYKRYDRVTVRNSCDTTYNIKVVWAFETDQCLNVTLGSYAYSYRDYPARFDGLERC